MLCPHQRECVPPLCLHIGFTILLNGNTGTPPICTMNHHYSEVATVDNPKDQNKDYNKWATLQMMEYEILEINLKPET